jgi:hypothetical protein
VADDRPAAGSQLERWVSVGGSVIAPATALSALLFYFGYVSSRSQYEYFGVDVDTIGLSTQDYIMRSPQPLLVPLLVLTLIGAGLLTLHLVIRRRIGSAVAEAVTEQDATARDTGSAPRVERVRRVARRSVAAGLVVLGAGMTLLFTYAYVRDWAAYNLVTPLLITAGTALVAYASHVPSLLERLLRRQARAAGTGTGPAPGSGAHAADPLLLRRTADVLFLVVIAAGTFWAAATVAQWSGRGLAQHQAQHLDRMPSVILDTKERLFLHSPGVEETVLPPSEGQTFHYRYRHLRLLIVGHDRMFLVPAVWSASDSTLIMPLDGSVRVQLQFQNEPP